MKAIFLMFVSCILFSVQAADEAVQRGQYTIAVKILKGENWLFSKEKGCEIMKRLANEGYPPAAFEVGTWYRDGKFGVTPRKKVAAAYFKVAGDGGHKEAQNCLGCMFLDGDGISQDYERAEYWLRKAADQNSAFAQNNLAIVYYTTKRYKDALRWFAVAATNDNASAQYDLGVMYYEGLGIDRKDFRNAAYWFQRAAENGVVNAQYNLGRMYGRGEVDGEINLKKTYYWLRKAKKGGNKRAEHVLNNLEDHGDIEDR